MVDGTMSLLAPYYGMAHSGFHTDEMHANRINVYPGNFKQYWRLKDERYEQEMKSFEAQKEYIEKQEEYIRRVHYGTLHKQAASRQKQIDKIERAEKPTRIEAPLMGFGAVRRAGDVVIRTEDLTKAYDHPLFENLSFDLPRGRRLGILGPNGSGKTTLLRVMLGEEEADSGRVQIGHLVEIGYYDQHLTILDLDKTVIRAVWPEADADAEERWMRDILSRFGLSGEQVHQPVGSLSGGERSRAALASPDLYRDGDKVKQATARFEELKARIATLYQHWEEAVEMNTKS